MPIFFQHQINDNTRLGVWKIEETEEFFKGNVPVHREVTNPHKRLQHLAGRFLLQFLYPDFPYKLIEIAETRKPYLPDAEYHFSISHCKDYAAAIVSKVNRVGIDVEIPVEKISKIADRFLSERELKNFVTQPSITDAEQLTLFWSAKESVFKWYGAGAVDFKKHIRLQPFDVSSGHLDCSFGNTNKQLTIYYRIFSHLCLSWIAA